MNGRAVIAFGGNALTREDERGTWEEQSANARVAVRAALDLRAAGHEVLLTHGNGPQVGALALQQAQASSQVPAMPFDALSAMTQGQLGYLLQQAIDSIDSGVPTATVLTRVVVAPDDPAFAHPTKPIGPFYDEATARALAAERGWSVGPDAGRGWRRMIASPQPLEVVEIDQIRRLLEHGAVVIAGGGGGIPVARLDGRLVGVEAVIDKDRCSAELASATSSDLMIMVTGVDRVALDFGTRWQRDMARLTVSDALRHLSSGEFPAGSMGPKIEAGARFVNRGGRAAVITSGEHLVSACAGRHGTWIVPDRDGPSCAAVVEPVAAA
ncbi:MAG: carbamate kinase [Solirubrobacteraceae bacterium]